MALYIDQEALPDPRIGYVACARNASNINKTFSVKEASEITGVPYGGIHYVIDAELLDRPTQSDKRNRSVHKHELITLKIAHDTYQQPKTWNLNIKRRRRLVRKLKAYLDAGLIPTHCNLIDGKRMKNLALNVLIALKNHRQKAI